MAVNDGGAAFPSSVNLVRNKELAPVYQEGMTLRQWYAGQALPALIGNVDWGSVEDGREIGAIETVVAYSHHFADAMIKYEKEPPDAS
ncbi:MAG: hypothetical protein GY906_39095 [bacterium]|nr:hypothetical protein [bacterium]